MARLTVSEEASWYVQKGARVLGPFSPTEVGRFLLLGRVRNTDRVSRDGELWEPVTQVPELVPEELLDLDGDGGWERFLEARASVEERYASRSVAVERRSGESMSSRLAEEWRRRPPESAPPQHLLTWSLLGVTVAAVGVVLWLNGMSGT